MRDYQAFIKQASDFIFVEDEPRKSDIIFIPGNGFPQNAQRAAQLYKEGYAPYVLPSGRYSVVVGKFGGVLTDADIYNGDYETEWEFMKDVLMKNGVPEDAILREDQATFTYENAIFSRQVTDSLNLEIKNAILCCKSYHARRALMYYELLFPEAKILVCPSCTDSITKENWILTEEGIDGVSGEISRILKQFSLMLDKR